MAVTYTPSNNRITVTGYTESAPCAFQDIYNADKAGTLSLVDRNGITVADASAVNNTYNLRPADEKLLGGAKHDLYVVVENWNATSATVRLIGTDENDASLTEDIAITGNGTYYATKLFKTLTQTQVTAFVGTSFDYGLIQSQWGCVSKTEKGYFISSNLHIGDGTTETYLKTANGEFIQVGTDANKRAICLPSGGHFQMGEKDSNGFGVKGSSLTWYAHYDSAQEGQGTYNYWRGEFKCYGSNVWRNGDQTGFTETAFSYGTLEIIDSVLIANYRWFFSGGESGPIKRTTLSSDDGYIYVYTPNITWDALKMPAAVTTLLFGGDMAMANIDFGSVILTPYYGHIGNLTDCILPKEQIQTDSNGYVYKKYHLDAVVADEQGNVISGASFKVWDSQGTLVVDTTTGTDGKIPTALITTYYCYAHSGVRNPEINYNPVVIKISKEGYLMHECKDDINEKKSYLISLKHSPYKKIVGIE